MESVKRRELDWRIFYLLTFLFGFGFSLYVGVFQNYIRDIFHAGVLDLGHVEAFREIPGFLTALMAGTLVALPETRIGSLGLVICGIGIGLSGEPNSFAALIEITIFWSIGFHLYATVGSAITMALAQGVDGGHHLGKVKAVGAAASIAGLGTGWLGSLALPRGQYHPYFVVAGGLIATAGVLCSFLSPHAHGAKRSSIVFKREYSLYYALSLLDGARRQIFSIFAAFTLILVFKQSLVTMMALQFVNAIVTTLIAPRIGRLTDSLGEKAVLRFYYIGLAAVFFGYAAIPNIYLMFGLYLVDNALFTMNVGITTYLHKIAKPSEFTPSLAMGTTMAHVAAVSVPWLGALLWVSTANYRLPFFAGVVLATVSLLLVQRLPGLHPTVEASTVSA